MLRRTCMVAMVLAAVVAGRAGAEELSRPELAKRTKPAVALVVAGGATGTGFCVQSSGLFLTSNHVVQALGANGVVKITLNSGLDGERVLTAKVLRQDAAADLALLAANHAEGLPALELGDDSTLSELTELVVFGFPFGQALAVKGQSPTVSVNVVNVSSLRTDAAHKLLRIQMDSSLNPGNSGGPVVDHSGKVVGVVQAGIEGAGINLAIPVSQVKRFLEKPLLAFTPPEIAPAQAHEPATFEAVASNLLTNEPLSLELVISGTGGSERHFPMKASGGKFVATAVAFPEQGEWALPVEIVYPTGKVAGLAKDVSWKVGATAVKLSAVKAVEMAGQGSTELLDGRRLEGIPKEGKLTLRVGEHEMNFNLAQASQLTHVVREADERVICKVVASAHGEVVGEVSQALYLAGTRHDTIEALLKGDFIKPLKAASPTTYMKGQSTAGDYIGQGKAYAYDGAAVHGASTATGLRLTAGPWNLTFSAARGGVLAEQVYEHAKRSPFNDDAPGMDISGEGRGSNTLSGKFVVWELEMENGQIKRLAIDFDQRSEGHGPPFVGMIRINSTLE